MVLQTECLAEGVLWQQEVQGQGCMQHCKGGWDAAAQAALVGRTTIPVSALWRSKARCQGYSCNETGSQERRSRSGKGLLSSHAEDLPGAGHVTCFCHMLCLLLLCLLLGLWATMLCIQLLASAWLLACSGSCSRSAWNSVPIRRHCLRRQRSTRPTMLCEWCRKSPWWSKG